MTPKYYQYDQPAASLFASIIFLFFSAGELCAKVIYDQNSVCDYIYARQWNAANILYGSKENRRILLQSNKYSQLIRVDLPAQRNGVRSYIEVKLANTNPIEFEKIIWLFAIDENQNGVERLRRIFQTSAMINDHESTFYCDMIRLRVYVEKNYVTRIIIDHEND